MTARPGPGTPGSVVYATDHRRGLGAFMAPGSATDPLATRSGIVHAPGSPLRVRQNTPLGMTALVNPGNTEIHRPGRGAYMPYNDAVATVAFDPAPASNSRYDLVYIAQNDSDVDASSTTPLAVIKGDATASAPKPYGQVPAGGLVLAEVGPIAVGTTQITDALIKNVAPLAAVRGAPIPVRSQAERDDLNAIASAAYPITVERLDTGALERNAGSGWVALALAPAVETLEGRVATLEQINTPWTAYTPLLTAASVNPTLGAGSTVSGRYRRIGRTVVCQFSITFGSTGVNVGNGIYFISLPVPGRYENVVESIGSLAFFDGSTAIPLFAQLDPNTPQGDKVRAYASNGIVSSANPSTIGAGDAFRGQFTYEAAA